MNPKYLVAVVATILYAQASSAAGPRPSSLECWSEGLFPDKTKLYLDVDKGSTLLEVYRVRGAPGGGSFQRLYAGSIRYLVTEAGHLSFTNAEGSLAVQIRAKELQHWGYQGLGVFTGFGTSVNLECVVRKHN